MFGFESIYRNGERMSVRKADRLDRVEDAQTRREQAKRTKERQDERIEQLRDALGEANDTLALLLELEPGLAKYRENDAAVMYLRRPGWDVDGMRTAVNLRRDLAKLAQYSEPVVSETPAKKDKK